MNENDSNRSVVIAKIRPGTADDLRDLVSIHCCAFPNFFLTNLGTPFLRDYYRLILEYKEGILLVASEAGQQVGFAAGFMNPDGFYTRMRSRRYQLLVPIGLGLLQSPQLLPRVIAHGLRISRGGDKSSRRGASSCEMASLGVDPKASGKGIGRLLVDAFIAESRQLGATEVYLTTDADGNERVNTFYGRMGFARDRQFIAAGNRRMNEYSKPLAASQQHASA